MYKLNLESEIFKKSEEKKDFNKAILEWKFIDIRYIYNKHNIVLRDDEDNEYETYYKDFKYGYYLENLNDYMCVDFDNTNMDFENEFETTYINKCCSSHKRCGICICGKSHLNIIVIIKNQKTNKFAYVGSNCIKKFFINYDELIKVVKITEEIEKIWMELNSDKPFSVKIKHFYKLNNNYYKAYIRPFSKLSKVNILLKKKFINTDKYGNYFLLITTNNYSNGLKSPDSNISIKIYFKKIHNEYKCFEYIIN